MPELPEVERATKLIQEVGSGRIIETVETFKDELVFDGITHYEFAHEIRGRRLKSAHRYGKQFYLELDGNGRMPVLHFGMTGMIQVKGQDPTYYKRTPKSEETQWPPRFVKFILRLVGNTETDIVHLAFMDARRLGRVRLKAKPLEEPPISELGFDPILSMPPLEEFTKLVLKRSCPIKVLLLDQSFSAGVGNWVADEILYNSKIHPEQRCNTLSPVQLATLHHQTADVCRIAVSVNADSSKFPDHWLFNHRWGKGKKNNSLFKLPSGERATIKWITVGGRTSAYVTEIQLLSTGSKRSNTSRKRKKIKEDHDGDASDLTDLSDLESETNRTGTQKPSFTLSHKSNKKKRKVS